MLNADPLLTRPTLTQPNLIVTALQGLGGSGASRTDAWHLLTENYVVDLDAVALVLPSTEPEPVWLAART